MVSTPGLERESLPWPVRVPLVSGRWYGTVNSAGGVAGGVSSLAINILCATPVFINRTVVVDRIGIPNNGAVVGGFTRLGIYTPGPSGLPTALLLDAGEVPTDTTGQKSLVISQRLEGGSWYWLAYINSLSGGQNRVVSTGSSFPVALGGTGVNTGTGVVALQTAQTYGPLPALFPLGYAGSANGALVSVRVA